MSGGILGIGGLVGLSFLLGGVVDAVSVRTSWVPCVALLKRVFYSLYFCGTFGTIDG